MSDLLREEIIDAIDEYADLCAAAYGEQLFNEELRKIQLLRDNQKQKVKDLLLVLANQNAQVDEAVAWMLKFDDESIVTTDSYEVESWENEDHPYDVIPLYALPPVTSSQMVEKKDAERYRWVVCHCDIDYRGNLPEGFSSSEEAIDAAIAADTTLEVTKP